LISDGPDTSTAARGRTTPTTWCCAPYALPSTRGALGSENRAGRRRTIVSTSSPSESHPMNQVEDRAVVDVLEQRRRWR